MSSTCGTCGQDPCGGHVYLVVDTHGIAGAYLDWVPAKRKARAVQGVVAPLNISVDYRETNGMDCHASWVRYDAPPEGDG